MLRFCVGGSRVDGRLFSHYYDAMTLEQYLAARGESAWLLAHELDIPHTTVLGWLEGRRPRADLALRIIERSKEKPTRKGGTITLEALAGFPA